MIQPCGCLFHRPLLRPPAAQSLSSSILVPPQLRPSSPRLVSSSPTPWLTIRMGGGPRTFPGGVSKWQWKRMQAKKAKQLLKERLLREKQVYEMRKRAELKAAISELERPWEAAPEIKAPTLFAVGADEQLKVLTDRFQKPGGFDMWSDRDGPQVFRPFDGLPSARFFPKGAVHSLAPYRGSKVDDDDGDDQDSGQLDDWAGRTRSSKVVDDDDDDENLRIGRENRGLPGRIRGSKVDDHDRKLQNSAHWARRGNRGPPMKTKISRVDDFEDDDDLYSRQLDDMDVRGSRRHPRSTPSSRVDGLEDDDGDDLMQSDNRARRGNRVNLRSRSMPIIGGGSKVDDEEDDWTGRGKRGPPGRTRSSAMIGGGICGRTGSRWRQPRSLETIIGGAASKEIGRNSKDFRASNAGQRSGSSGSRKNFSNYGRGGATTSSTTGRKSLWGDDGAATGEKNGYRRNNGLHRRGGKIEGFDEGSRRESFEAGGGHGGAASSTRYRRTLNWDEEDDSPDVDLSWVV